MKPISDGSKKFLAGTAAFFLMILVFGGGQGWYVQNEIVKKYHREITENLVHGGDQE